MSDSDHESDEYASAEEDEDLNSEPTKPTVEAVTSELKQCEIKDESDDISSNPEEDKGEPMVHAECDDGPVPEVVNPDIDSSNAETVYTEDAVADSQPADDAVVDDEADEDECEDEAEAEIEMDPEPAASEEPAVSYSPKSNTEVAPSESVTSQPSMESPAQVAAPEPTAPQPAASSGGWGSWSSWGMSIAASAASVLQQDQPVEEATKVSQPSGEDASAAAAVPEKAAHASGLFGMFGGAVSEPAPTKEGEEVAAGDNQDSGVAAAAGSLFGMFGGVSGLSATLQEKGGALVAGSLDTLELIGKKTVQVLTEDDPGFRGARKVLAGQPQRPNLSEMLKEARTHADTTKEEMASVTTPRQLGYNDYFEEYHGMVHLEALELLSRQSSSMVSGMMSDAEPSIARVSKQFAAKFSSTREEAELVEDDEDTLFDAEKCLASLQEAINDLQLELSLQNLSKMINGCAERCKLLDEQQKPADIHEAAIRSLAQLTAASVEVFHKTAELLLLPNTDGDESAESVASAKCTKCFELTQRFCEQLAFLSNSFVKGLNSCPGADKDNISALVTSVFLEAASSASFTRDGCDFLLPSVQVLFLSRAQS